MKRNKMGEEKDLDLSPEKRSEEMKMIDCDEESTRFGKLSRASRSSLDPGGGKLNCWGHM